jgi:hypothetical protein
MAILNASEVVLPKVPNRSPSNSHAFTPELNTHVWSFVFGSQLFAFANNSISF